MFCSEDNINSTKLVHHLCKYRKPLIVKNCVNSTGFACFVIFMMEFALKARNFICSASEFSGLFALANQPPFFLLPFCSCSFYVLRNNGCDTFELTWTKLIFWNKFSLNKIWSPTIHPKKEWKSTPTTITCFSIWTRRNNFALIHAPLTKLQSLYLPDFFRCLYSATFLEFYKWTLHSIYSIFHVKGIISYQIIFTSLIWCEFNPSVM